MSVSFLSKMIPQWIRSSIALKVSISVGSAIIILIALQTLININQMNNKLTPLVIQNLQNTLKNSENIFKIVAKQAHEDAHIIGAHNSLANYLDYELLGDKEGMNEELVNLEQFIRSLINFKPQYQNIEIITNSGSIIHFAFGKITTGSNISSSLTSSTSQEATQRKHHITYDSYFSHNNKATLFTLIEGFDGSNPFTNTTDTANNTARASIKISSNISGEINSLKSALQKENTLLTLGSKGQVILTPSIKSLPSSLWLTESLHNSDINLSITLHKEKKSAFLIITDMKKSSLALAIGAIFVIGISLLLTAKYIIDAPLKNIIRFINKDVLIQNNLKSRYPSKGSDEIGVFSDGINNMLDQIEQREAALKNSEERLALSLWGGDEGMWELTKNAIHFDRGSERILQLDKGTSRLSISMFRNMIHPDDAEGFSFYINDFMMNKPESFTAEIRIITPKNNNIWVLLKGKSTKRDPELFRIMGTLVDISQKVLNEQQTQLYATAFDSSNNGIAILDPEFHILAINRAYSRITGYSSEEASGTLATFIGQHEHAIKIKDISDQIYQQGHWNGEIIGKRRNNNIYVRDVDLNPVFNKEKKITHYVCVFADITEKKKSEKELWKMANHDILTKLPNRGYFRKQIKKALEKAKNNNGLIALLFLDLDKFKQVNDNLGHEAGDELLIKVAKILSSSTRANDTVARLGGDEFAILLEGINEKVNAELIARKLIEQFNQGINIQQAATGIGVSIGISFFPFDADDAQTLVHCADTAMYSAKTTGSNLYHFYHTSMRDHVNRRNQIENELIKAIKADTLCLYYQPQYNTHNEEIIAFEALSRWFHPDLGYISPEEFITIAEDTGLIAELGANVFCQAIKQLKYWHVQGYSNIRMAINVSPKQFMLTDVQADIEKAIKKYDVDPRYIELELTESLIIEDPEKVISVLNSLKDIGIRLSIDDFGTGYSSLSYLSLFPLNILKIDKSFVQQVDSDKRVLSLTKAIIGIAHSLDLEVIAEGVETKAHFDILKALGAEYIQGYYYNPAVSAIEAEKLLIKKPHTDLSQA